MTACVTGCDRVSDARLCRPCAADLRAALDGMSDLVEELHVTLTRQANVAQSDGVPRRSSPRALPYHTAAGDMLHELRAELGGWVRVLDSRARCADTIPAMARWLSGRIEQIRGHEAADAMHGDILAMVRRAWHVVDLPAPPTYAGPCDCGGEYWLRAGAAAATCRGCGETREPRELADLMRAVEGQAMHASAAVRILRVLGYDIGSSTVRQWAYRQQVQASGVDAHGRSTYRIRDLLDLLDARRATPA